MSTATSTLSTTQRNVLRILVTVARRDPSPKEVALQPMEVVDPRPRLQTLRTLAAEGYLVREAGFVVRVTDKALKAFPVGKSAAVG